MSEVLDTPRTDKSMPPAVKNGASLAGVSDQLSLLERAIAANYPPEMIREVMELEDLQYRRNAERAFNSAMPLAYQGFPPILKTTQADRYKYEQLGEVVEAVSGPLGEHGLSPDWDIEQPDLKTVRVTCNIRHAGGHCKSVSATATVSGPPATTPIQQLQGTVTSLQRLTLKAALGLGAREEVPGSGQPELGAAAASLRAQIEAASDGTALQEVQSALLKIRKDKSEPDEIIRALTAEWQAKVRNITGVKDATA